MRQLPTSASAAATAKPPSSHGQFSTLSEMWTASNPSITPVPRSVAGDLLVHVNPQGRPLAQREVLAVVFSVAEGRTTGDTPPTRIRKRAGGHTAVVGFQGPCAV